MPKGLEDGVFYISLKYRTAAHNCCCGCGTKIITPIKPGRWRLEQNGNAISLFPSVGNWSAVCQSHYWIEDNRVRWARTYTKQEIAANRASDFYARQHAHAERTRAERAFWKRLWDWIKVYWNVVRKRF
jgi:Family of unknown function (DUF6527)